MLKINGLQDQLLHKNTLNAGKNETIKLRASELGRMIQAKVGFAEAVAVLNRHIGHS
jgi:hypothetical protein